MKFLFFFLDGVGLGSDDPDRNPLARAEMFHLQNLLDGRALVMDTIIRGNNNSRKSESSRKSDEIKKSEIPIPLRFETNLCSLLALDACLGVKGLPQSATGQTTLLTGENMSAKLGYHYGPKPNTELAQLVRENNLFKTLSNAGINVSLLNAYPPVYLTGIESGKRKQGVVAYAVNSAGIRLKTVSDLLAGNALSADFTGKGWCEQPGFPDIPQLQPFEAGKRLGILTQSYDFSFFEYWLSDYVGHRCNMNSACASLEMLDQVLGGLLDVWDDENGLILITSDHGNLEDLNTRHHTSNFVPALVIGAPNLRLRFTAALHNLSHITPAVLQFFNLHNE